MEGGGGGRGGIFRLLLVMAQQQFHRGSASKPRGTGAPHKGVSYSGNGLKVYDSEHTIAAVIPLGV